MKTCPNCGKENITKLYIVGLTFEESKTYCSNCIDDRVKAESVEIDANATIIGEEINGE